METHEVINFSIRNVLKGVLITQSAASGKFAFDIIKKRHCITAAKFQTKKDAKARRNNYLLLI